MIPAKDLRIGNWVDVQRGKVVTVAGHKRVAEIHKHFVSLEREGQSSYDGENYEDVDPVVLTPEILQKCGFTYFNNNSFELRCDYGITLWGRDEIFIYDEESGNEMGCGVKYLHQLQNLYSALTGNELQVKL